MRHATVSGLASPRRLVAVLFAIAVLLVSVADVRAVDPLPVTRSGFSDTLLISRALLPEAIRPRWGSPTDIEWTPDGRLLITQQMGQLWVYTGDLNLKLALDINSRICHNSERGLVGLAVDPDFVANGYIYVYYTRKTDAACPQALAGATSGFPINRVSRFVFDRTSNTVAPGSETVLLDHIVSHAGNHNSGYLHIAADGYLYVSVGETGKTGMSGRDDSLRGKILRINRASGDGAPDNPHAGNPQAVRCGNPAQDRNEQGLLCREVFAKGLRNPFRLAFKPNSNEFFINDVGKQTWEEISVGAKGANYGWDKREGPCAFETACVPGSSGVPPGLTVPNDPIFWYRHTTTSGTDADAQFNGCNAVTGAAFVPPGVWPAEYDGDYIFGDYVCGRIWQLQPNGSGRYQASTFVDNLFKSSVVALMFGPGPNGQSLYYSTFNGGGQVHRVDYTGSANRRPQARLTADRVAGSAPLTVNFDASASSDPDGDALTYLWDFGIVGSQRESSTPTTTFNYSSSGAYVARLRVRDSRGEVSDEVRLDIDAGNSPPQAAITAPEASKVFKVGEQITLRATASDASGPVTLSWQVLLRHNEHEHPWAAGQGSSLKIVYPAPEDLDATRTSHLRVILTATDPQGVTTTVERILLPKLVDVTFRSVPSGLGLEVNRVPITTPRTLTSWHGYELAVRAVPQADSAGRWWVPSAWSDGAPLDRTITTLSWHNTYKLTFQQGTRPAGSSGGP